MSGAQLSAEWLDWLKINIDRGCATQDLMRDMLVGGIAEPVARAAIVELTVGSGVLRELPTIDTAAIASGPSATGFRLVAAFDHPQLGVIDDFLSMEECRRLIDLGTRTAQPAAVVDTHSGSSTTHAERRGSMAFMNDRYKLVRELKLRMARLVRWPIARFERLQVIGYLPGDEYRAHFDWFNPMEPGSAVHLAKGGQRVGTLLVYLDEPTRGGATVFPNLGNLRIQPQVGRALWFRNITTAGDPETLVLHAGETVLEGAKHVCTAWLRERTWTDDTVPTQ